MDDKSGQVLTTTPLLRCANRLLGNVSLPQATVRYRIVGRDASGRVFNSTLSPKTIPYIGAKFRVEAVGDGHMEVETGQPVTIPLTVHNFLCIIHSLLSLSLASDRLFVLPVSWSRPEATAH